MSIVNAVEEGRALFQNIRKFLTYVLVHNVAELVPYLTFALFRIPLPLTPIQALFVDMGTDSLTALGLGTERPVPQRMRLPPRSQNERLLNLPLAVRGYLFLGLLEATAAMSAFFFVLLRAGWRYGDTIEQQDPLYLQGTTAYLCSIIAIPPEVWLLLAPFGIAMLVLEELRKWIVRRSFRERALAEAHSG